METGSSSSSFSTNWMVEHGSLEANLTFDSSAFPIDETTEASPRDYLVLKPASPVSGLCEIKISFSQKHEVRQVYVRSTARVYEIYYSPYPQSGDEYLCTVRCGIATKEVESCHARDQEAMATIPIGSSEELIEEKAKSEVTNSSSEDDWVEVKVLDCPSLDGKTNFQSKGTVQLGRTIQDVYEATAEISDASPCFSITLRLLSLQTKGSVHVEEIYVFADAVESTGSDQVVGPVDDSSRSSLMAMLVPTLLQLSKSGSDKMQDRRVSDTRDGVMKTTNSSSSLIGNKVQQEETSGSAGQLEMKNEELTQANEESMKSESSMGDLQELKKQEVGHSAQLESVGMGQKYDSGSVENGSTCSRLDRVLDQLVSRIERLEMVCSRFEENMLKPLAGIETRLGRLEQQLEVLATKSERPGLYSCNRISAPEFSCNESESNSFYNDGNENHSSGGLETATDNSHFDKSLSATNVASLSVDVSQFPGVVITAPEFSNADEDDDGGHLCDGKDCTEDSESAKKDLPTNKRVISIDDALASALSGFLFSAAVQPPQYTESLVIKAPDFTNEDDWADEKLMSSGISCKQGTDPESIVDEENGNKDAKDSASPRSMTSLGQAMEFPNIDVTKAASKGPFGQHELNEDGLESNLSVVENVQIAEINNGEETSEGKPTQGCPTDQLHNLGNKYHDPLVEFTPLDDWSPINPTDEGSMHILEGTNAENKFFVEGNDDQTLDSSTEGAIPCIDLTIARETQGAELSKNVLQNILDHAFVPVDFNTPVLEVEFIPKGNWNVRSTLDALLSDLPETEAEVSCVSNGDIEVTQLLPDIPDDLTVKDVPSNREGVAPLACSREEPFSSLI